MAAAPPPAPADELKFMEPTPEMEAAMKRMNYGLVKQCDMDLEMRQECMDEMIGGVEKYPDNMEAAAKVIKEAMDKKYGGPWHCIVGEGFGFSVQYEGKHLCYVFHGGTGRRIAILLYKSCQI